MENQFALPKICFQRFTNAFGTVQDKSEKSLGGITDFASSLNDGKLNNMDMKELMKKAVGHGLLEEIAGANFAVKGHAGKKRSTSKKPNGDKDKKKPKKKSKSVQKKASKGSKKSPAKPKPKKSSKKRADPDPDEPEDAKRR